MMFESSPEAATAKAPVPANARRHYRVTRADLPLSCPMPDMPVWNSHPRICLPIVEEGGSTQCNYCGAHFELTDDNGDGGS